MASNQSLTRGKKRNRAGLERDDPVRHRTSASGQPLHKVHYRGDHESHALPLPARLHLSQPTGRAPFHQNPHVDGYGYLQRPSGPRRSATHSRHYAAPGEFPQYNPAIPPLLHSPYALIAQGTSRLEGTFHTSFPYYQQSFNLVHDGAPSSFLMDQSNNVHRYVVPTMTPHHWHGHPEGTLASLLWRDASSFRHRYPSMFAGLNNSRSPIDHEIVDTILAGERLKAKRETSGVAEPRRTILLQELPQKQSRTSSCFPLPQTTTGSRRAPLKQFDGLLDRYMSTWTKLRVRAEHLDPRDRLDFVIERFSHAMRTNSVDFVSRPESENRGEKETGMANQSPPCTGAGREEAKVETGGECADQKG